MPQSSENQAEGTQNELQQMERNPQNDAPTGVENLEQNIQDATSRYDDIEFSNDPKK